MILSKNQVVVFENGAREGYLEARWSERNQAFYTFNNNGEKIYSNTIETKSIRRKAKFNPNKESCTVQIYPCGETEKAYQIYDGSNGKVGRDQKSYFKYIAKSICYIDKNGNIYAPSWA